MSLFVSRGLQHQLLRSHLKVASIGLLVLALGLCTILWIQYKSNTVADLRVPTASATAKLTNNIERSVSELRSLVLLGRKESADRREQIWDSEIRPTLDELADLFIDPGDQKLLGSVRREVEQLRVSQWWVEDVSQAVGNVPSRMIYERELLPVFDHIQSAILGLNELGLQENTDVNRIRLSVAMAHQSLSEAVRRLSDVVRTGQVEEIKEFRHQTEDVELKLEQLSAVLPLEGQTRELVDWIRREYQVYREYAEMAVAARRSHNWNRALYALQQETMPLAQSVLEKLADLQRRHAQLLKQDVAASALASQFGVIGLSVLILMMIVTAVLVARVFAKRLAAPIEELSNAVMELGRNEVCEIQSVPDLPDEIAQLNSRFNEMSVELARRQRDLEYANQELQTYSHVITHDLKPPLINVRGHARIIQEAVSKLRATTEQDTPTSEVRAQLEAVDDELRQSTEYIRHSLSKMGTMVTGVLDNSRFLFRSLELDHIDLSDLIADVTAMHSHLPQVSFDVGSLPSLISDRFLLEHVFANVIDNAVKFRRPEKNAVISIRAVRDQHEYVISVEDNGRGLPAGVDIFRLFKQGDPEMDGSGVGLSLTRTVVNRIGGSISAHDNQCGGATFTVTLPALLTMPDSRRPEGET